MKESSSLKHLKIEINKHIDLIVSAQNLFDNPPRGCSDIRLYRECQGVTIKRLQGELRGMVARKVKLLNSAEEEFIFSISPASGQTGPNAGVGS